MRRELLIYIPFEWLDAGMSQREETFTNLKCQLYTSIGSLVFLVLGVPNILTNTLITRFYPSDDRVTCLSFIEYWWVHFRNRSIQNPIPSQNLRRD
jgi:hypothetical protein